MVRRKAYLSKRLLIRDHVHSLRVLIAAFKLVADELWAECFDHQVVVVKGRDDGLTG
jgi:hypothetical protein